MLHSKQDCLINSTSTARMGSSTRLNATKSRSTSKKTVHLLRHGQTEMNVYLANHEPGFEDPLM